MSAAPSKFWQGKPWKSYVFHWFGMKKHEKTEAFRVWGVVWRPRHVAPGLGTSFLTFLKSLKILIFLNRKFHEGFFDFASKISPTTNMYSYNRISYSNCSDTWKYQVLFRKVRLTKNPSWNFNYISWKFEKYVYYIRNDVPTPGEQI